MPPIALVAALRRAFETISSQIPETGEDSLLTDLVAARPLQVSSTGIALIKRFEGCARRRADGMVESYPDPGTGGAPWTIGWGATGQGIGPGTIWTQQQCDDRLLQDIARHAHEVELALAGAPTSQHEFDALVSFHYNTGAIARATLTRRHRAGQKAQAATEFARWTRASGRVLRGLVRRREAEARLYRGAAQ
ncbi:MAG: lysozyme [Novosphingobium sp.]|nr:lysozyme [Novosphingobium sp.]